MSLRFRHRATPTETHAKQYQRAPSPAPANSAFAPSRFARGGRGKPPGDWRAAGFSNHRPDAAAVLRALPARPEINPAAVGAVGYSEGALHAAWLGAHARAAAV